MTAAKAVCPGRSTSPARADRSGTRWFHALPPLDVALKVTWAVVAGGLSAIAEGRAVSRAAGMLSAARIVMLGGVTEVHHG
jgi:hypothetical protein